MGAQNVTYAPHVAQKFIMQTFLTMKIYSRLPGRI